MWYVTPYKWMIEGVVGQGEFRALECIYSSPHSTTCAAIGGQEITCGPVEYVALAPPNGTTCSQYLTNYTKFAGGYLLNPDDSTSCLYCPFRTTDEYLSTTYNFYSHPWKNFGISLGFVVCNVSLHSALLVGNISDWSIPGFCCIRGDVVIPEDSQLEVP